MIEIDGSQGEGGGQMLRTAVALSAVTGKPLRISNIRANRSNPGLAAQHLAGVKAVAELCGGDVKGLALGSREMEFVPGKIVSGKLNIDVGTAGSVSLVLQALMIPALFADGPLRIQVRGGTDVSHSPSIDYLRHVTLPILRRVGFDGEITLLQRGYYPKGGGRIVLEVNSVNGLKGIDLLERGKILSVKGISNAHRGLEERKVASRQAKSARTIVFNRLSNTGFDGAIRIEEEYVNALSLGSGITLYAGCEHSVLGVCVLGERSRSAESVGSEAAEDLAEELFSGAALDRQCGHSQQVRFRRFHRGPDDQGKEDMNLFKACRIPSP
jgi:RNA 3'-phosphate cyclase